VTALTEVKLSAFSPERFRSVASEHFEQIAPEIAEAREQLAGRVIWHVNSTARGGGVAEMLHSYLSYARGAGVDVRWAVIGGGAGFFEVTKRIHNNLHGNPGDGGPLGAAEAKTYERTLAAAADSLTDLVRKGDVVFLHDPQTAGLADRLGDSGAAVIWRCHVGVDKPNELVRRAWDFLRGYVSSADALVFSRSAFVWEGLEGRRIWIMPPTIDAFSPKNQDLSGGQVASILQAIGLAADGAPGAPTFEHSDGTPARVDRAASVVQEQPLPVKAPVVAQVSRWDRLKDPLGVLRCFAEHLDHDSAHLVLAGPDVEAVDDDPEGAEVLAEVRAANSELGEDLRRRVHLVSLPMDDLDENAAMVNAIQRRADVVLQKSIAEGFGLTVAEAMWKARPVVAGRVGGIQDQIVDGESGVLVDDPSDLAAVAAALDGLLDDPHRAAEIGRAARRRITEDFLQIDRLIDYFEHLRDVLPPQAG
jgi:trehalose synthase